MQPVSFLDDIVERFRQRWHTDSQYRAMMSGLFGVIVLIALCTCAGTVSVVTNNVLSGSGFGVGGNQGAQSAPGGLIQGAAEFPTASLPPWTPAAIPNANPVPPSLTPIPTPTPVPTATPTPTATPCVSNCGGGGGGGGGGSVVVTITGWSPDPWKPGNNSISFHTSVPNDGINILITNCQGGTVDDPGPTTDGSGNYTFTFNQKGNSSQTSADVWVTAQNGTAAGVHAFPKCG